LCHFWSDSLRSKYLAAVKARVANPEKFSAGAKYLARFNINAPEKLMHLLGYSAALLSSESEGDVDIQESSEEEPLDADLVAPANSVVRGPSAGSASGSTARVSKPGVAPMASLSTSRVSETVARSLIDPESGLLEDSVCPDSEGESFATPSGCMFSELLSSEKDPVVQQEKPSIVTRVPTVFVSAKQRKALSFAGDGQPAVLTKAALKQRVRSVVEVPSPSRPRHRNPSPRRSLSPPVSSEGEDRHRARKRRVQEGLLFGLG